VKKQLSRAIAAFPKTLRLHLQARYAPALVVLVPILLFLVYQVRVGQTVHVGVLTDDKPYVVNFNDPERTDFGLYRWTKGDSSIRLPGLGRGAYRLTLRLAGSMNPSPSVEVLVNGNSLQRFDPAPGLTDYTVEIPASATQSGDVIVQLRTTPFQPRGDARQLGVVLTQVTVEPVGDAGILLPPDTTAVQLWALVLLAYLLAWIAGFGPRDAGIVGGAVALGWAALLLVNRPWLTVWVATGGLVRAALFGLVLCIVLRLTLPFVYRLAGLHLGPREVRWPVLLATLFFVAHFGGDLHPHTRIVDLFFHANRYTLVNTQGQLLLMVESREWGTRETIYPPTAYLFMRPLRPLVPDVLQTVLLFMALAEATRLCLVYLVARKSTGNPLAAIFAAAVFGIVPMAYLPFSWGIATNVFGAWCTTAIFALLVLGYDTLRRPAVAALLTLAATLGLLSHPGEFVLVAATLGGAVLLFGVATRPRFRGVWPVLLGTVLLSGGLAFALLYRLVAADMLSKGLETFQQKLGGGGGAGAAAGWRVGGAIDDPILGLQGYRVTTVPALIRGGLVGYWREAWGYYYLWPPVLALGALPLMRGTKLLERLRLTSILWWLVAALFALAGLLLNVYVRYAYSLLPVIAVGAGLALARISRAGRWGRAVVALLLVATTAAGLWLWYLRISVDGH
jgi:hypothetical protein